MKLIIDIPEVTANEIKDNAMFAKEIASSIKWDITSAIVNGIPLEQEPKTGQFAEWVAEEIFDENWEYNKDAFAELACRKLAKLGIVRAKGDEWELVEPQEGEE